MEDRDVVKLGIDQHSLQFQFITLGLLNIRTFFVILWNEDSCWRWFVTKCKISIKASSMVCAYNGRRLVQFWRDITLNLLDMDLKLLLFGGWVEMDLLLYILYEYVFQNLS